MDRGDYGALDLREAAFVDADADCAVTPVLPGEPVILTTAAGELWRKLVARPVEDSDLGPDDRSLAREFADYGIASSNLAHPHRTTTLGRPWLSSPTHELVYALIATVAADADIPLVFIKGPMQHAQGIREREHSGDVDIWVLRSTAGR